MFLHSAWTWTFISTQHTYGLAKTSSVLADKNIFSHELTCKEMKRNKISLFQNIILFKFMLEASNAVIY